MRWSLHVVTLSGIGVYVHVTFFALLGFFVFVYGEERGPRVMGFRALLIVALFSCVLLHELGHALAARRFGIATRDITILPIGGVARLESVPRQPFHEFVIALAGPLVNLAIVLVLIVLVVALPGTDLTESVAAVLQPPGGGDLLSAIGWEPFLGALLVLNALVTLLNLVPAFPLDGGRILRSLLATGLRYDTATQIAATCSQLLAVVLILIDLTSGLSPYLSVLAVFVFLGTFAESNAARLFVALEGSTALDGAEEELMALTADTPLGVARTVLSGQQSVYPVFEGERLLGILGADDVLAAQRELGDQVRVAEVPLRPIERVAPDTSLSSLFDRMSRRRLAAVAVTHGDRFLAIVTPRSIQARAYSTLERREASASRGSRAAET